MITIYAVEQVEVICTHKTSKILYHTALRREMLRTFCLKESFVFVF